MKTLNKKQRVQRSVWIVLVASMSGTVFGAKYDKSPVPDPGSAPLVDAFNPEAAKRLLDQGIREVVFIKRHTFESNHYYTEYLNSKWLPGGNLCVLNLETGNVREVAPELNGGVFYRFDVSFDAKKIVFDYKKSKEAGYKIYEINVDGSGLRQLTFGGDEEAGLSSKYSTKSHSRFDDLHPCYLPDGGIVFVSTRCQYGILCDSPDNFTTTVLHRMDGDGSNIRKLSNSVVSEAAPVMLPDGRILYHRWEYNDKTQSTAKCLWAMRPDGSGSVEVYGNMVDRVSGIIYGRPIPETDQFVALACSHCCPNNAVGTVIKIDPGKGIRTEQPLSFVTKDVDVPLHNGFSFLVDGQWVHDERTGRPGRLFKDPYPISEELFMVAQKPKGYVWCHPNAYDLCLLDGEGASSPLYQTKDISCWHPMALVPREKPPVLGSPMDEALAAAGKAHCMVTDVYIGLDGVERGTIKYLRVLEQVPRPWSAYAPWGNNGAYGHSALGMNSMGLKAQYGVVPVEEDGSAFFEVPAGRNIYFQALDENYLMVQTERSYINYIPGETRSCLGCHETPDVTPASVSGFASPLALRRAPSIPQAQAGEESAQKVIDFMRQVQPVLDAHCIRCHGESKPSAGLDLTSRPTKLFTASYENLMGDYDQAGVPHVGERRSASELYKPNHVKAIGEMVDGRLCVNRIPEDRSISYKKPYFSGVHTAPLVIALSGGDIVPRAISQERIDRLVKAHKGISLSQREWISVVNWIDTFGQFYPSYWGLKDLSFQGHEFFRPEITFDEALSLEIPERLLDLYQNPPSNPEKSKKSKSKKSSSKKGKKK
ncbi:HzsA-related protein [Pontiella sulfatireligans]|uniref:Hydrazine synthase alpha subunit middle domain-containing protein n=1 Tax=Pontiella sulfatireligans TaxID=2750658 RepID=A0A6C2UEG2_9BACT|nr:hypothetical protein [Pontiella sulfatireligans]VGO18299.1 hypothetical protein SCARR_00351 [Pontiella sulfatireligans]